MSQKDIMLRWKYLIVGLDFSEHFSTYQIDQNVFQFCVIKAHFHPCGKLEANLVLYDIPGILHSSGQIVIRIFGG